MPRVLEDLDLGARHQLACDLGVLRRDQRIAPPPDHERRQHARQVEAVGGTDALAARVEHRPHRVQERLARLGVAQRGVAARHLREVGPGPEARSGEQLPHGASDAEDARVRDQRQHDLRAGQRGRAKEQMHLAPDPAARDEHEPLREGRVLVGELHRDPAAQRVADHGGAAVAEGHQEVAHRSGVGAERVVAARLGGLAVAEQVGRHDRVALGEHGNDLVPLLRVSGDAVDQEDHRAAAARGAVHDAVAVEGDLLLARGEIGDRLRLRLLGLRLLSRLCLRGCGHRPTLS